MVDIFEEVDEELRNDEYQALLRKYGPWALGAALALVAGTAGYQGWSAWDRSNRNAASDQYAAAQAEFDAGRLPQAASGFDALAENGAGEYSTLALMQRGAVALEAGDRELAAQFFDRAADAASDPVLGDLAALKSVWARWDDLSYSDVEIRLTPLSGPQSPYRYVARESVAAAALRDGRLAEARDAYQLLSFQTGEVPQGVVQRAMEAIALLDQIEASQPAPVDGQAAETAGDAQTDAQEDTNEDTAND